jgi:hypothetical protein
MRSAEGIYAYANATPNQTANAIPIAMPNGISNVIPNAGFERLRG